MQMVHQRDTFQPRCLRLHKRLKNTRSEFQTSYSQTNTTEVALRPFTFPSLFSFFPSPLFLTSYLQKTGKWLLSCILVIRPQAGQITQLQSCAFLHGVDWLWSILNGGLCRLKRGCH
ncbi:hypothetical protein AVEN_257831-1 [Araneus ventricosus]|uniref:Uncharacterized protein n=1 Tax=Araneus ventricosus TaxID=182803 RepID=A0A4Y2MC71_ARAVE|nr:hypothetical protein AVEN_257831-1 [Araneus ventricosus]